MVAPLRTIMVSLWVSCLAGAVLVMFLSLGWMTWVSFAIAGLAGIAAGVPAGLWSAKAIKRDDPNWPPRRMHGQKAPQSPQVERRP